jgi:hypothetical protein
VFNVERILVAMTNVDGDPSEPWRAVNGFWGKVVRELGLKNKLLVRKNSYQRWIEDRKGLKSQYTNTMTMYMMERNVTPEVLAMDVSNIFKPKAQGKLGNIVAETFVILDVSSNVSLFATRGNIVAETKFASREAKCFLPNSETFDVSLCFSLMFPSVCPLWETWRNIGRKQCFRNNVS